MGQNYGRTQWEGHHWEEETENQITEYIRETEQKKGSRAYLNLDTCLEEVIGKIHFQNTEQRMLYDDRTFSLVYQCKVAQRN